ncbi:hypothetical protein Emed_002594 [Eimeria media]
MLSHARGPPVEWGAPPQAADEPPSDEPAAAAAAATAEAAEAAAAAEEAAAAEAAEAAEAAGVARQGKVCKGPTFRPSPSSRIPAPVSPPSSSSSSSNSSSSNSSSSNSSSLPSAEVYLDRLFTGNLCCKLWFTVRRAHTRSLMNCLTHLLRLALTQQREDLNSHIPQPLLDLLVAHAHEVCCLANHKIFWPYPPTLFRVLQGLQVRLPLAS